MTGILNRVGRIQDAAINWQETRYRRNEERQQQANLHRQRMTCSDSLRFDTQSQDWIGGMGVSPSGRFQVVENTGAGRRLVSTEGIRWDAAWIVIIAVAVLCLAILMADLAGIGMGNRTMSKLDSRITELKGKNEQIEAEIARSSDDISVCTEAVKLNLISGNAAQTIRLAAPAEANLTISSAYIQGSGQ